jgi:tRNA(fMet)-specific endonuclease VapC
MKAVSELIRMTGNNECFLDTNIVIELFRKNVAISQRLQSFQILYISSIAVGELYYGAYAAQNPSKKLQELRDFLINCTIISCDNNTAIYYGQLKFKLRKQGTPIPENDIWIAALTIQYDLPLYTLDKHFDHLLPDLELL